MHELSIAHSILSIAEKAAAANNNGVVTAVGLQIGELSGIETDSLAFAFSIIREGTRLHQAELKIELISGEAKCLDCSHEFPMNNYAVLCPECSSNAISIIKGKEMKVVNISMED
jgi:hydrogenase nickel incorporation protein HypA/HybF